MTVTFFFTKHHTQRKILKHKLCRVVDSSKKVQDLNCEVQDLLLEVVDRKPQVQGPPRPTQPSILSGMGMT